MLSAIWAEIMTPSTFTGPLEKAYRRAVIGRAHAMRVAALESERAAMIVSRFQAMAALLDAGLLSQVNTSLADAGPLAQLAWAEATEFRRNSPTIAGLAAGLGLNDMEVDDLFRAAALIIA